MPRPSAVGIPRLQAGEDVNRPISGTTLALTAAVLLFFTMRTLMRKENQR